MTAKPTGHHAQAISRMADDDRLVQVHVRIRVGTLSEVDALARRNGQSRAEVLRDAARWLVAREARWLARERDVARQRKLDDERRALAAQLRVDERF